MVTLGPLVAVLAVLVSAAGVQDLLSRRISNLFPMAIVLLFVIASTVAGWQADVWQNLVSFVLILAVGALLFQRGVLGGGDVKLWAAAALWFKFSQMPLLILSISLAGGAIALALILRRSFRRSAKSAPGASRKDARSVPYGVAIAVGTIVTITVAGPGLKSVTKPAGALEQLDSSLMNSIRK